MYEGFKEASPLCLFYGKAGFYQMVYEIYEELKGKNILLLQPEAAVLAKRYMDEHYFGQFSIEELGNMLGISASHLRSTFKSKYGVSPQEYLVRARIGAVRKYLLNSDYLLKEIAYYTGFYDEFHMSRHFKKLEGISPLAYRAKYTYDNSGISIVKTISFSYNENCSVSLDKLKKGGVYTMHKNMRNKMAVVAVLSAMLLLSACSLSTDTKQQVL